MSLTGLFKGSSPVGATAAAGWKNSYARLPERFYVRQNPTPVAEPRLLMLNVPLAEELGLNVEVLASAAGVEMLAGNRVAPGAEPLAMAYAGHQFGHFVPALGDGRANLLGDVEGRNGRRYDVQLKGSGPTAFSRRGDGRAAMGPVLREYLLSEAMATMGVPTTRALAAVATGETVWRETALPGAVLTRVAASHLRVGTFQYFAAKGDAEGVRVLAEYAIERHYPEAARATRRYRALLEGVIGRQARLVAQWMSIGFIHGVMNTDNMAISGETIDYGPCAFMEAYDPAKVYSSIDRNGRYAYENQPHAAHWNLTRLAESLLSLLEEEEGSEEGAVASAREALAGFATEFDRAREAAFRQKLGLLTEEAGDAALVEDLLERMAANRADFTLTFRRLGDAAEGAAGDVGVRDLFAESAAYDTWAQRWRERLRREDGRVEERVAMMRRVNPAYIPRNHIVQEALDAAVQRNDLEPFKALLDVGSHAYEERPGRERYATPARPEECVRETFCGT